MKSFPKKELYYYFHSLENENKGNAWNEYKKEQVEFTTEILCSNN